MSQDRRLRQAVHAFAQPEERGNSLWIGRPGVKLRAADGTITAAGRRYENMVRERGGQRPYEHAGHAPTESRIEYRNGAEYIEDRSGNMRATRRWDAAMNGGQGGWRFTAFGQRADHNTVRYTVEVPVIVRFWRQTTRADGSRAGEWSDPYKHNRMGAPFTVPLNSDQLGRHLTPGDLRAVRNVGDHERQKQFIAQAVQRFLLTQPMYDTDEISLNIVNQSDTMYTVDTEDIGEWRNYTFSTEVVSHHRDGAPTVETILNRPLRGEYRLPAEFLWKLGLVEGAKQSYDGKCCAYQLIQAVQKRDRATDRRNARDVFTLEDVEAILDDLQFELYPGHYHVAPPPVVPEETKRELAAYIPLWTGEGNERRTGYITPMRPRELHDLKTSMRNLTQRSELPPLAGVLKRHGMTLEAFFRLFPERFRIYGGRVVLWTVEEDDDTLEQRGLAPAEPYAMEGWRTVGVTSHMILGLARRLGRCVYVIHNDHAVYTFKPDGWDEQADRDHTSALVYNVWGDHAFFYAPEKACDAAKLSVRPLVEVAKRCLAVHGDHLPDRVPFENQRHFNIVEIEHYYAWARSKHRTDEALARELPRPVHSVEEIATWRGHWRCHDIKAIAAALSDRGVSFYPKYVSATKFASVTIRAELRGTGRRIVISELVEHHEELAKFCDAFSKQTGFSLKYHGESMSVVGHEAMRAMLVTQRLHCDRDAIAGRQQWRCICGGSLREFEVHHLQPVEFGGASDPSNLVALCRVCHAVETEQQKLGRGLPYAGFASQLSPRMTELFLRTPKPKQWHQGPGTDTDVSCLDVCGCRRNGLVHSRPLPVFGPADELEPFEGDVDSYDYFWVRCDSELDEYDSMVYDGEHLYPHVSVEYMLDTGIIELADIKYTICASRSFDKLPKAVEAIRAAWDAVGVDNYKLMCNSTIGLWNQRDKSKWTLRETGCFDDMGRVDVVVSEGDGPPKCAAHTQVISPETCFPLGLIALHYECVTVHRAIRELQSIGATIHGVNVDGIFYTGDEAKVDTFIDSYEHPDGTPVYAKKEGLRHTCPRNEQSRDDHEREFPEQPELVDVHDDSDPDRLAQLVVAHGSALITGAAGTGKTYLLRLILALLKGKVVNTAMTHAASRLMPNGQTLQHVLHTHRYGRVADTTFCIDEIGMVPLSTLVRVASWQLMGAEFILLGDFKGQFEPICDHWRGPDVESSGIVRQMAKGLHVHLSTNRRAAGDDAHFAFYTGLYSRLGQKASVVEEARAAYPWKGQECTLALVVSHRTRRLLNRRYNESRDMRDGVLVKCAAGARGHNQPQDMWLRPGMRLICCCKAHALLVNGVFYTVEGVDDERVVVRMDASYHREPPEEMDERAAKRYKKTKKQEDAIELSHTDASLCLRLSHALCYASVQGLTIGDRRVLLLDLEHHFFSVRSLIVGLSRVTKGSQIHVASREQAHNLVTYCKDVPPPPDADPNEVEEPESEEEE